MAESVRLEGRNGVIWRKYITGWTQERLAEEYGIHQTRVSQIIQQVRDSIPEDTRQALVLESVDMLRELMAGAVEVWQMAPVPVTVGKDGDILRDPESGDVVRDHGGRLRALETALKVQESIRRLVGADAAKGLDVNVTGVELEASRSLAEEARRRVMGESDGE